MVEKRKLGTALAILAVAGLGVIGVGCGDSSDDTQNQIDEINKQAEDIQNNVNQQAEDLQNQAQQQLDEAKQQAEDAGVSAEDTQKQLDEIQKQVQDAMGGN